jgi:hypothetical protein
MKRIYLAALVLSAMTVFLAAGCMQPQVSSSEDLRQRWLKNPMSISDIEAKYTIGSTRPFGANNAGWERLKRAMKPGDELWFYTNPGELWVMHQGEEGFAIVRKGKVVDWFVCRSN